MSELEVFSFEDADGVEQSFITLDPNEARDYGQRFGFRVIAHRYAHAFSEVWQDYTGPERSEVAE